MNSPIPGPGTATSMIFVNWKTSLAGISTALLYALDAYKHGMTIHQWAIAAGIAIFGFVAGDHNR